RENPVYERALRIELERFLERRFRLAELPRAPEIVPERDIRPRRSRIEDDGLSKRLLGFLDLSSRKLEAAEGRIRTRLARIDLDGVLHLCDGAIEIFEAYERRPSQQYGIDVPRRQLQRCLRARVGLFKASGALKECSGP